MSGRVRDSRLVASLDESWVEAAVPREFAWVGSKLVQLSLPHPLAFSECVGRDQEVRKVLAAWMDGSAAMPMAPLLIGEPGLGKNKVVYECARVCGKELYIIQGREDTTEEDLICLARVSDDPSKKIDYLVSPLITAMVRGEICFIDEIGKIQARTLSPLSSLLDERCYLDSNLLGERIFARPGFRCIAATNYTDMDYGGLPDFMESRLRPVIHFGYPERQEIEKILRARFTVLADNGTKLLDRFWQLWHTNQKERPPTPRDALQLFGYALNAANCDATQKTSPGILEYRSDSCRMALKHLKFAFETFFHNGNGGAP